MNKIFLVIAIYVTCCALSIAQQININPNGPGTVTGNANGTGSVTSITAGCGLSGGTITTTGTIKISESTNAQIGTTYTIDVTDCGRLVTLNNASPITVTVPAAGVLFPDGFIVDLLNAGSGAVTLSGASGTLNNGQSLRLVSTGSTWRVLLGGGGGGSGDVVGPASSGNGNIPTFNGTTGKLLQDSSKTLPIGDLVGNGQNNTYTTGAQDFSAASSMKIPVASGPTPTANGLVAYDSSSNRIKIGQNGSTGTLAQLGSGTPSTDDCAKFDASGNLVSAGGACGVASGDVTGPGSSTSGNLASFSGTTGKIIQDSGLATPTGSIVGTGQSNTFSTGAQSFASATSLTIPTGSAAAPTGAGQIALNTTSNRLRFGNGSTSSTVAQLGSGTPSTNDCAKFDASGNLVTAGAACGTATGDVTGPGSSTSGNVVTFNGTTGKIIQDSSKAAPTGSFVGTGQSNTFSTGAQSFASATSLTVPTGAGAAPTADGVVAYDTTADRLKVGQGATTGVIAQLGTGSPANNDCAKFDSSGNLVTAGAPCSAGAASTNDMRVTRTSGTVITIGDTCSSGNPCNVRFDNYVYAFTASMTATIASGSGSGVAQVYVTSAGTVLVDVPSGAGLTVNCSAGCTVQSSVTPAAAANSIPLGTVSITSGAWVTVTDTRALLANHPLVAGTGMSLVESAGVTTVGIDTATIPQLGSNNTYTGSNDYTAASSVSNKTLSSNPGTCTVGQFFQNTTLKSLLYCGATNTWYEVWAAGGTPSISAGAGAGSGPTVSLTNATRQSGTINVTTGTSPSVTSAIVTITFADAFANAPNCVISPNNQNTAILSNVNQVYPTTSSTTLVINSNASALSATTAYKWFYVCGR